MESDIDCIIRFEEAWKSLNSKTILKNFNLKIQIGEKLALKARSGSGKTTILNLIMGFSQLDSGSILIKGEELNSKNISRLRSMISWLPQNVDIIGGDESVLDVILRPFKYSANKEKLPGRGLIEEVANRLNLETSILENSFCNLSGGEKQRIGLMICYLLDSPIILLDEPSSALDKTSAKRALELFMTDVNKTVISATHDELWLDACTKIIELYESEC